MSGAGGGLPTTLAPKRTESPEARRVSPVRDSPGQAKAVVRGAGGEFPTTLAGSESPGRGGEGWGRRVSPVRDSPGQAKAVVRGAGGDLPTTLTQKRTKSVDRLRSQVRRGLVLSLVL